MEPKNVTTYKVPPRSLGEETYDRIRKDILACVLAPGESCSENQLAEAYGVGKAPVRWALAALTREGLVKAMPRRGHTVAPVTIESVNDLFGIRLILEPAAARLAVGRVDIQRLNKIDSQLDKSHQQVLKALLRRGSKTLLDTDRRLERNWVELNKQFHIEITRAAGNDRLTQIVVKVLEESQRANHVIFAVYEEEWRSMAPDHQNIVDALSRGDGPAAERITREHLERSRRVVIDALLTSSSLRRAQAESTVAIR